MSAQNPQRSPLITTVIGLIAFSALAGVLAAAAVTPGIAVAGVSINSSLGVFDSLPDFIAIDKQSQQNRLFAKSNGKVVQIATIFDQNRQEVAWNDVSKWAKDAAVSGEDRRFYQHGGIDLTGIIRAAVTNVVSRGIQSGASTITQQLVKNIFVQQSQELPTQAERDAAYAAAIDTSFARKLKEMKLAIALEKKYTKNEILLAYLNIANFGRNTYGIQAAAEQYYNTTAKDLTAEQAASLIAIVQYPELRGLYNPANYPANQNRRDVILQAMLTDGDLTQAQYDEAKAIPVDATTVTYTTPKNGCIAANEYSKFFCDYVLHLVPELTSLGADATERQKNWKRGGYDVYTSLDLDMQTVAQKTAWKYTPANTTVFKLGSTVVSVEVGTGKILVMAENKKFNDTQQGAGPSYTAVNFATDFQYGGSTGFQTGSTYKPFTLLTWLEAGHGLNEIVDATPRTFNLATFSDTCDGPWGGPYTFRNFGTEKGPWSVYNGTAHSVNGVFLTMAQKLDLCQIKKNAMAFGLHRADDYLYHTGLKSNPSSVLGINEIAPLTMAVAYAGFANSGRVCNAVAVVSITDPNGKELPGQDPNCRQAMPANIVNTANYGLQAVMNFGSGRNANPRDGTPFIGKTGTTDSGWHTWVVGASRKVATAVWVGNISGSYTVAHYSVNGVNGAEMRHVLFKRTMISIDGRYHGGAFAAPDPALLTGSGVKVPNVAGQTVGSATAILQASGFLVKVAGDVNSDLPIGTVAKTNPGTNVLLSRGYEITIYTSNGLMSAVPDVVGAGTNTFGDAQSILNGAGFTLVTQYCKVLPALDPGLGYVVSSNPATGRVALRSREVRVYVGALTCP
jgi:membrane peptidoglycan carboxypeptidase